MLFSAELRGDCQSLSNTSPQQRQSRRREPEFLSLMFVGAAHASSSLSQ